MSCDSSPILRLVDFVDQLVSGGPKAKQNGTVVVVHLVMLGSVLSAWHTLSDKDFSFVVTLAGFFQMFGFFLLLHKVRSQKSVAGVSSKMLQVYVLVFCFRLPATMVKNGYLPVDATGDWLYQATDVASLLLVFQLLYYVHKPLKETYQSELDSLPIWNFVVAAVVFGFFYHGDLNASWVFDKAWTISLWLDTVAMLPQLWMLSRKGGEVEGLTANFVALIFLGRCLNFYFWYCGYPQLAPKDGGFNKMGFIICSAHSLQLLISADFMYYYFMWQAKNRCDGGMKSAPMVLPMAQEMEI